MSKAKFLPGEVVRYFVPDRYDSTCRILKVNKDGTGATIVWPSPSIIFQNLGLLPVVMTNLSAKNISEDDTILN